MFRAPTSVPQEYPAELLHKLNTGPNFRSVVNPGYSRQLPPGAWRLSFGRVSPVALQGNTQALTELTVHAFNAFERSCASLLANSRQWRRLISAGVDGSSQIIEAYLNSNTPFSVRRLDIVLTDRGPLVNESDEMPGGLVHAYWLDRAYGVNQDRWRQALDYLTSEGPLLFVVSDDWSKPYIEEIDWFATHLRSLGYPAAMATTRDLRRIQIKRKQVEFDGQRVGTIWRLFPVFETEGGLADLVAAANKGIVRLVPEFASWGNKAWFGAFWSEQARFRASMPVNLFSALQRSLPHTAVVADNRDYPQVIKLGDNEYQLRDHESLMQLSVGQRAKLVAKAGGAHRISSRSHGVLIGRSAKSSKIWKQTISEILDAGPLIVQSYGSPSSIPLLLWSVLDEGNKPTLESNFEGRVLLRPWMIGGRLVSCTAFASPPTTSILHGNTHGSEIPLDFG